MHDENPATKEVADKIKEELDRSVENLDASVLSRLRQAREKALAAMPEEKTAEPAVAGGLRGWIAAHTGFAWASGVALAAVFAVTAWFMVSITMVQRSEIKTIESWVKNTNGKENSSLEIVSAKESFEFYEELVFYQWLADKELNKEKRNAG